MTDSDAQKPPVSCPAHRNEVTLVGRVSAPATRRELPSGSAVVSLRLVVQRDPKTLPPRSAVVDTIECASWSAECHAEMERWSSGDIVEVVGALRRRFRRGESGPISRYEVEAARARLLVAKEAVSAGRTSA
ncbi:single-stranded DNA-binding protein [Actinopolymorpha singaporensis]|uniref:Single-strand DNA-binding protein n=1 Tax=Actinopolymorpha singaporensis TaxID=117157 RepID=A0A1H1W4G5_9ACTN|nr:single-stranded DNA-binding protein [Actinopolymorpha singaporensis]SDS91396.1 single-strand DNA-binding protein [Actinopolymorpha singaporensis]